MDVPMDYKIELDRLIFELEIPLKNLVVLAKTLPNSSTDIELDYGYCSVSIDLKAKENQSDG